MTDQPFSLDIIDVASPCSADWEKMCGTDKVRHCGECELNVYHLSNMSRDEAETLVREHEGRICVRFYRRADGTVLTRDCPVGLRAIRRQLARLAAGVAAMLAFLAAGGLIRPGEPAYESPDLDGHTSFFSAPAGGQSYCRPLERLARWLDPDVSLRGSTRPVIMGK